MEKSPGFVGLFYLPATSGVFPSPAALIPIPDYIDSHPAADLTLETLGRRFYMNQSYLSRLFKKGTGSNIHEFIIYKRISQAKKLPGGGGKIKEANLKHMASPIKVDLCQKAHWMDDRVASVSQPLEDGYAFTNGILIGFCLTGLIFILLILIRSLSTSRNCRPPANSIFKVSEQQKKIIVSPGIPE
jgi:AraC-like DNA-binding protein